MIARPATSKKLGVSGGAPVRGRASLLYLASLTAMSLCLAGLDARAEGGSKDDPDLQVDGYTVFGTNTAGATVVTSGWGNIYMDGSLQIHSNLHVDGQIISTNLVRMTRQTFTQHDQWLAQGATIQPTGSYIRVRGETMPVTLGSPQIADGAPGQLLTLQGVSNLLKVTLANGDGLYTKLEQPFALGAFDTIQFIYDDSSSNWVEINRSQNRWNN